MSIGKFITALISCCILFNCIFDCMYVYIMTRLIACVLYEKSVLRRNLRFYFMRNYVLY